MYRSSFKSPLTVASYEYLIFIFNLQVIALDSRMRTQLLEASVETLL